MGPCLGKLKSSSSSSSSSSPSPPPPHPPISACKSASSFPQHVHQELIPLMASQPDHFEPYAHACHLFPVPAAKPHREGQKLRSDQPSPVRFAHPPRCRCRDCQPTLYSSAWSVMKAWPDRCVAGCRCERCGFMREVEARQRRRLREER